MSILCSLLCTYMYIHCENWQFTNKCLCLKDLRGNTALWYWTFDGKIHSTHKYVYVNMSVLIQLVWSSLVVQCQTKCHIYLKYNEKQYRRMCTLCYNSRAISNARETMIFAFHGTLAEFQTFDLYKYHVFGNKQCNTGVSLLIWIKA